MENFNKLVPIDGENGEKRTISSLQIAEITGKAYCGVLKVIRKMDIIISRKTKCSAFTKHFVPESHLLTQIKM